MRALLQRVSEASVTVGGRSIATVGPGLVVFAGVGEDDTADDCEWMAKKVTNLRIFEDQRGVMNLSLLDVGGELLVVSQFTLMASTHGGNRPSYSNAAPAEVAAPLFDRFVATVSAYAPRTVSTGHFGAEMRVALVNQGPVTIWLDSRARK